jgi:large subunit ribosomal protein L31
MVLGWTQIHEVNPVRPTISICRLIIEDSLAIIPKINFIIMKQNIHPNYHADAIVTCSSCGTKYEIGSVIETMTIAICAKCHPFYTGNQQVVVDTANKISTYKEKQEKAAELQKRKQQIEQERLERAKSRVGVISSGEGKMTLRDLLKAKQDASKKK